MIGAINWEWMYRMAEGSKAAQKLVNKMEKDYWKELHDYMDTDIENYTKINDITRKKTEEIFQIILKNIAKDLYNIHILRQSSCRLWKLIDRVSSPVVVNVIGMYQAGKSTFINVLLKEIVLKPDRISALPVLSRFIHSPKRYTVLHYEDGETETVAFDFLHSELSDEEGNIILRKPLKSMDIFINSPILKYFTLCNIPSYDVVQLDEDMLNFIAESDAVFWIVSCEHPFEYDRLDDIKILPNHLKPFIIVNKIDTIQSEMPQIDEIIRNVETMLADRIIRVIGFSAKQALEGLLNGNKSALEQANLKKILLLIKRNFIENGSHYVNHRITRFFTDEKTWLTSKIQTKITIDQDFDDHIQTCLKEAEGFIDWIEGLDSHTEQLKQMIQSPPKAALDEQYFSKKLNEGILLWEDLRSIYELLRQSLYMIKVSSTCFDEDELNIESETNSETNSTSKLEQYVDQFNQHIKKTHHAFNAVNEKLDSNDPSEDPEQTTTSHKNFYVRGRFPSFPGKQRKQSEADTQDIEALKNAFQAQIKETVLFNKTLHNFLSELVEQDIFYRRGKFLSKLYDSYIGIKVCYYAKYSYQNIFNYFDKINELYDLLKDKKISEYSPEFFHFANRKVHYTTVRMSIEDERLSIFQTYIHTDWRLDDESKSVSIPKKQPAINVFKKLWSGK